MARPPYKAEQRNQIFACFVSSASEIMEHEGMEALTLRKVARKAGYNSATLYNYFKDLDHLAMYASMKYFQEYNRNLNLSIADIRDAYPRFLSIWSFFCDSAFRYPYAFYQLFFGKYSGQLEEIIKGYYTVFPEALGELGGSGTDALTAAAIPNHNRRMLLPLVEEGYLTPEQIPVYDDMMVYCFKELLHQKMEQGDALDRASLVERQLGYIKALLHT